MKINKRQSLVGRLIFAQGEQSNIEDKYDDEVHPSTKDFWSGLAANKSHSLNNSAIMSVYGPTLSRNSYNHVTNRVNNVGANNVNPGMLYNEIMQRERPHRKQLEELAKNTVANIWGFPKNQLNGSIDRNVDINNQQGDMPQQNINSLSNEEMSKLKPEVGKRINLNAMSHGSAVNNMMQAHHMSRKELDSLDPKLLGLYDKFSALAHQMYWHHDLSALDDESLGNTAIGSSKVEWDKDDNRGQHQIKAKAFMFPVLIQELSKGIHMLLNAHGLRGKDDRELTHIYKIADAIKNEPWLIQAGSDLWRKVSKVLNVSKVNHAKFIASLASKSPDEVNTVLMSILDNNPKSIDMVKGMVSRE